MLVSMDLSLILTTLSLLGWSSSQSDRSSRRQRILSILQTYQPTQQSAPAFRPYSYNIGSSSSGVARNNGQSTWVSWNREWYTRTTPPPTVAPPESPYDLWYYRDDGDNLQGPFSSSTMLEWQKAGYFRPGLLLRREVDNVFTNLAGYTRLYGRSPFSRGNYPRAIIVRTTTTTTTTTTSTTPTTTTSVPPHLEWQRASQREDVTPIRGDGIIIEDDDEDYYEENPNTVEWGEEPTNEVCPESEDCRPSLKDGTIRLTGGRDETEGNVEIYHEGIWGGICDDEWDKDEAKVACKSLGFPGAEIATNGARYGYSPSVIWMDNLYCYGTEKRLDRCRFDGWGAHDCERTEAAGVVCTPHPPSTTTTTTTTPKPKIPMVKVASDMDIRLAGGRTEKEGRIEMKFDDGDWGVACGDGWGVREAIVACKQLGLGYAAATMSTSIFGGSNMTKVVSGIGCKGNEESLMDCGHDDFGTLFCPGEGMHDIAAVSCTDTQADLEPDLYQLMTSAYLEDKPLFLLQCAMEENCVASQAYVERQENPYWQQLTRRLLRFTTAISNIGSADFRPFIPKESWEWHACHQHYHSMETFSHFEILNSNGNRMVEGHKASFCLEDNDCHGVDPHYDCENYGDQGITAGCKDIYYYNIDCQWIDITDLPIGVYTFKMAINPEYKVPETTFENNAALCTLHYNEMQAVINNCSLVRP